MKIYVDFENHKVICDEYIDEIWDSPDFGDYVQENWEDYLEFTSLEDEEIEEIEEFEQLNDCQQDDIYQVCFEDYIRENFEIFEFPHN